MKFMKKVIQIEVTDEEEKVDLVKNIKDQLADNPDYLNGDIILTYGTPNMIDLYFTNDCKTNPKITI